MWYNNLSNSDIVVKMDKLAKEVVDFAKKGEYDISEDLRYSFEHKFKEVIPVIVDMKTEYWRFRNDNNVYNNWDKCQRDLWAIRNNMEDELFSIYSKLEID